MNEQEFIKRGFESGLNPNQVSQAVREYRKKNPPKTIGGFAGNVVKSFGNALKDTATAAVNVFNPDMQKNTVANVARLGVGLKDLATPGDQGYEKYPIGMAQFYNNRYGFTDLAKGDVAGAMEKTGNTLYNDPTGVALDASSVLAAGGALTGAASKLGQSGKASIALNSPAAKLGRTSQRLYGASKAIDPIYQTGKLGMKGVAYAGDKISDVGKGLETRSYKFNQTNLKNIQTATGADDINASLRSRGITGGATQAGLSSADDVVKAQRDVYNSMVRSGQPFSRQQYGQALMNQALDLIDTADDPSTRSIANQLWDEGIRQMGDTTPLTNTQLANTKSRAFARASGYIDDPAKSSFNEQLGRAGADALETQYQGSKALGKELRGSIALRDAIQQQARTGKGTQLFNLFKPTAGGGTFGGILGSAIPGVGTLGGAAIGMGVGAVTNSPRIQNIVGRGLQTPMFSRLPAMNLPRGYLPLFQTRSIPDY